jgi:ERCC4-type nuclease
VVVVMCGEVTTRTSTMTEGIQTFPALRGLSRLADLRPCIIIDTREQTPLTFPRLPTVRGTLQTGDYSFRGGEDLMAVERKSITDLVACCVGENRDRFFRELHRMRGFRFRRLLIIGSRAEVLSGQFRANVSPKSVLATLSCIEARYCCPVVFAATPVDAAILIEDWAWWLAREVVESANSLLRGCEADVEPVPILP